MKKYIGIGLIVLSLFIKLLSAENLGDSAPRMKAA